MVLWRRSGLSVRASCRDEGVTERCLRVGVGFDPLITHVPIAAHEDGSGEVGPIGRLRR